MEIKGRPFSGSITEGSENVLILGTDETLVLYFTGRFPLGASTMSVPTGYYIEEGSTVFFYSGKDT